MEYMKVSAAKVAAEVFSVIAREKKLLLILFIFFPLTALIFLLPLLTWYASNLQASLTQISQLLSGQTLTTTSQPPEELAGWTFLMMIPYLLLTVAGLVVWSRATTRGLNGAFEGGFGALFKRTLKATWRFICTAGWGILLAVGWLVIFFIISLFFGGTVALLGSGGSGFVAGLFFIFGFAIYAVLILSFTALTILSGVSLFGEANDIRLPIHTSFSHLSGNLLRASGMLFLVSLAFYIVQIGLFFGLIASFEQEAGILGIIGTFIFFAMGSIYYFFWITYGALYASKLVPEVRSVEFKDQIKDVF